jgi:hypothetical protein
MQSTQLLNSPATLSAPATVPKISAIAGKSRSATNGRKVVFVWPLD